MSTFLTFKIIVNIATSILSMEDFKEELEFKI